MYYVFKSDKIIKMAHTVHDAQQLVAVATGGRIVVHVLVALQSSERTPRLVVQLPAAAYLVQVAAL